MKIVNIYDAKTHLSQLIEHVMKGNEVIIAKAGKPVVKLMVYRKETRERKPGYLKGKIKIADDFDQLPQSLLNAFKGEK